MVPEDVLGLMAALSQVHSTPVDYEFRIANALSGLRWLQVQSLAPGAAQGSVRMGVLTDITAAKHAALRERFSFESTQILVGTSTLESAVTRVIQLVCENLGWEWGAFWAAEPDADGATTLACRHFWHLPHSQLSAFTRDSQAVRMGPGEGLVGEIMRLGRPLNLADAPEHPTIDVQAGRFARAYEIAPDDFRARRQERRGGDVERRRVACGASDACGPAPWAAVPPGRAHTCSAARRCSGRRHRRTRR